MRRGKKIGEKAPWITNDETKGMAYPLILIVIVVLHWGRVEWEVSSLLWNNHIQTRPRVSSLRWDVFHMKSTYYVIYEKIEVLMQLKKWLVISSQSTVKQRFSSYRVVLLRQNIKLKVIFQFAERTREKKGRTVSEMQKISVKSRR